NFGFMGWAGMPFDVITALVASIVVGVGIDYSIHVYSRYSEERRAGRPPQAAAMATLATTGRAVLLNAAAVAAGFLVLLLSTFPPLRTFGFLVALTMGVSSAAALTVLPALLVRAEERRWASATPPAGAAAGQWSRGWGQRENQPGTKAGAKKRKEWGSMNGMVHTGAKARGMGRLVPWTLVLLLAVTAVAGANSALTADEILDEVEGTAFVGSGRATIELVTINARGQERSHRLALYRHETPHGANRRLEYLTPADVAGTKFLTIDEEDEPRMWPYLPALGRERRIAGSAAQDNFMGTDFPFEEIGSIGTFSKDYAAERLPDEI